MHNGMVAETAVSTAVSQAYRAGVSAAQGSAEHSGDALLSAHNEQKGIKKQPMVGSLFHEQYEHSHDVLMDIR